MEPQEEFSTVPYPKAKAAVWRHFGVRKRKADGSIVENVAVCLTCQSAIKTGGGTSNLTNHIRRHHPKLLSVMTPSTSTAGTSDASEPAPPQQRQQTLLVAFEAQAKKNEYPANSPRAKGIIVSRHVQWYWKRRLTVEKNRCGPKISRLPRFDSLSRYPTLIQTVCLLIMMMMMIIIIILL